MNFQNCWRLRQWPLVLAIFVAFCGASTSARAEKIRVGLQNFLSYANVFIALDKGYFRDAGLEVETTMIRGGGNAAFSEVIAGQHDISSVAITASMLNDVIKGANIRVIADKGQIRADHSTNELWITKALHDSGVKDITGLKGKTVATSPPGGSDWLILAMMADKFGLSVPKKDILAAGLPAPQRVKALESGTVAGAILVEPFISQIDRSKAVRLMTVPDLMPVFQTAVYYTNEEFLKKHAMAVQKFLGALHKATAEYMKNPKDDGLVAILSKYTKVSPTVIKQAVPVYFSPDGKVDVNAINAAQNFLLKYNLISRKVRPEELISKDAM